MADPWLDIFSSERAYLIGLAYRMLGSVSDAEDMVQEAWLRWRATELERIDSPRAWLTTITTRLCIDRLRVLRRIREDYTGPWLPEPILTDAEPGPEASAILADSLSTALLLILERLSPVERAVFLLREAFDYDYGEISHIVGKTEPACRQTLHRAKQRVAQERPRFFADRAEHERLLAGFGQAVSDGDLNGLLKLFADDIELWSDGGGKATAALNVVRSADHVARFFLAILSKMGALPDFEVHQINGVPGIVALRAQSVDFVLTLQISGQLSGGRIDRIFLMRNPDKLGGLFAHEVPEP